MASDLLLFQISSVSALIGMTLGWRGVMTRYSGFYDLPTAWSNVFWGILLGGIYGSQIYTQIIIPNIEFEATNETVVNPLNLVLLCLIASIIAQFYSPSQPGKIWKLANYQWLGTRTCCRWDVRNGSYLRCFETIRI